MNCAEESIEMSNEPDTGLNTAGRVRGGVRLAAIAAGAGAAGLLLGANLASIPVLSAPSQRALQCEFTASAWDVSKNPHERVGPDSETQHLYLEFLPKGQILSDWPLPDGSHNTNAASVRTTSIDYFIDDGAQIFDVDRQTGVLTGGNRQNDGNEVVRFNGACRAITPRLPKV
jgi:hypothetical protein